MNKSIAAKATLGLAQWPCLLLGRSGEEGGEAVSHGHPGHEAESSPHAHVWHVPKPHVGIHGQAAQTSLSHTLLVPLQLPAGAPHLFLESRAPVCWLLPAQHIVGPQGTGVSSFPDENHRIHTLSVI